VRCSPTRCPSCLTTSCFCACDPRSFEGGLSGYPALVDERRLTALAGELGLTVDELRELEPQLAPGVAAAVMGGLIRFEDALFELSQ
jgi:hypothetical protein